MIDNSLLHYKVIQHEFNSNLSPEQQLLVETKLNNDKKNEVAEWLLWIFLGRLGFHRFYLNKPYGLGIFLLNIFGWILTLTFVFAFIGIPMICAAWIWWLIDGFYIHNWIQHDNDIKKNNIINEVTTIHQYNYSNIHHPKHFANYPKGKHFFHSNK